MIEIDWDKIVVEERPKLYGWAYTKCKDRDLSLDLVQETFLKAYKARDSFKGGNIGGWLQTILKNVYVSYVRKNSNKNETPWDFTIPPDVNQTIVYARRQDSAESDYLDSEISKDLSDALDKLQPDLRESLELDIYNNMTPTEVSKYLGMNRNTVGTRKFRAIRQMRELLGAE